MAQETKTAFSLGSVLERGFSIYFRNIVTFSLIALLVIIPYILLLMLISQGQIAFNQSLMTLVLLLLNLLLTYLATAAIAYGTFKAMQGQGVSISDCLSRGLALVFPVLGVAILSALAVLLGLVLLIVPGLIVLTMLWVAIPVAVVERPGVTNAMRRSAELTKGNRWRVFGIIVILALINAASGLIVNVPFVTGGAPTSSSLAWNAGLSGLLAAFQTALAAVMATVVYHDLRVAKEGIGVTEIARVFD
ncbi:MAG: hypothetical protein O7I42_02435 [Alphaproteobacteria bacterium]|nr:hypothetical protein [Alphaproteobacteria bacterium]